MKRIVKLLLVICFLYIGNIYAEEYYYNLSEGLTQKQASNFFAHNGKITFKNKDGGVLDNTSIIKTGDKVSYTDILDIQYNYTIIVPGDVIADGVIKINDVSAVYKYLKNNENLEKEFLSAADYNNSGTIQISDVSAIYRAAINKQNNEYEAKNFEDVILNYDSISLPVDSTAKFAVSTLSGEGIISDIKWSVQDNTIATVDDTGLLKGVKAGETYVIAETKSGMKKTSKVNVYGKASTTVLPNSSVVNEITYLYQERTAADVIILNSNGKYAMVDTGNKYASESRIILDYLKSKNITKLEFILITHAHKDHIGGVPNILNNGIKVKKIYVKNYKQGTKAPSEEYTSAIKTATSKNVPITYINNVYNDGDSIWLNEMELKLYNTKKLNYTGTCPSGKCKGGNDNFNAIVTLVNCNGKKTVLSSDSYDRDYYKSLAKTIGDVDVLQVPHHGYYASGSSKTAFTKLNPEIAIITNTTINRGYDNPTGSVIESLPATTYKYYVMDYKYVTIKYQNNKKIKVVTGASR